MSLRQMAGLGVFERQLRRRCTQNKRLGLAWAWDLTRRRLMDHHGLPNRFVGKLSGLYPEQPMDALAVDEVMDVVQDVLTRTPQDADADVKKAKREEYAAGKLKGYMALLAHRCQSTDGGPYVLGASLTIADLVLYYYVLAMLRRCGCVGVCVGGGGWVLIRRTCTLKTTVRCTGRRPPSQL
jgi:hypothetical protein